jgi:Fic family protein
LGGPEGAVPVKDQNSANEPLEKQREENLKLANQTRQDKKRKKIDEIINLFLEKRELGRHDTTISNDEVEKLLHVSDATATRYLETLEKEGKIKQIGKTGKGVRYEKV